MGKRGRPLVIDNKGLFMGKRGRPLGGKHSEELRIYWRQIQREHRATIRIGKRAQKFINNERRALKELTK